MSLRQLYKDSVAKALQQEFSYKNAMQVPKIRKVVLNVGASKSLSDGTYVDIMEKTLQRITGQKPVKTKAKKSISNFKIRQGQIVGLRVTLRGQMMWDFLDKLVNVTLPRIRDFQGLSNKAFDKQGNYTIGFPEFLPFPEVSSDEVEKVHGLEVTIVTSASNALSGFRLLQLLGFPFKKTEKEIK